MKIIAILTLLAGSVVLNTAALANADDDKWIAQCVTDNKDATTTPDVVKKYCTCMDNKMSDSETRSITQWEKSHPTEMAQCDKESGWK